MPDQVNLREHFDWVANNDERQRLFQSDFYEQLKRLHQQHVLPGSKVLEWGCGRGDLLAAMEPSKGLGLDFSSERIRQAQQAEHPNCQFAVKDLLEDEVGEAFDYILMNYLTGYIPDLQQAFENARASAHPRTRLIVTTLNHAWLPLLTIGRKLGWVTPQPPSNWLSRTDLQNLLELAGWEVVTVQAEQMLPFDVPGLSWFFNRVLVRCPLFWHFGATIMLIARPATKPQIDGDISCSVIVPARNEAGNIRPALERIPTLGKQTEIIFVEGNSTDDTWETIQRECDAYEGPHRVTYTRQPGKGKWDAVQTGFSLAKGDVLVIQDGDLTAPPEDLPKFYEALASGKAEFVNGSRLVYPMESRAMRFLNLLGNKFFAIALSFILRQDVKDSLCGTKMMLRSDYEKAMRRVQEMGDFDPFGDFNLLFGSARIDLRIRDVPVRYRDRTYGDTNISRFKHGLILFKMTWFGLWNLRFPRRY